VRVRRATRSKVELRVIYNGYTLDKNLEIKSKQDGDRVELKRPRDDALELGHSREPWLAPGSADAEGRGFERGQRRRPVEAQTITGNLDIHTGDGHIRVDGAKGQIKLRTGDGSIEGRDLDGKIEADSGDGHITLDGRFDTLNIRTGDGSINAHALPDRRF